MSERTKYEILAETEAHLLGKMELAVVEQHAPTAIALMLIAFRLGEISADIVDLRMQLEHLS